MSIAGCAARMGHMVGGLHVFFPDVMQFGGVTLNIYTLVGIVTLAGLISKHGILIVDVANRLQREGHLKRDAVELGRRHPAASDPDDDGAMALGVVPLLLSRARARFARFAMGW
jgi:multidrug efflux pump